MIPEYAEQIAVMEWARICGKQYPELRLLHHVPNERRCSPQEGAKLKRMGVKAGVPDIVLPVPRGQYHGLYIELKRRDGGTVQQSQRWWINELSNQGYKALICSGADEAIRAIREYMGVR